MKNIRRFLAVIMVLVIAVTFNFPATAASGQSSHWSHSIAISDKPAVTIELVDAPQKAFPGDIVKFTYRIINERENNWSAIDWKIVLPEDARVMTTTYSEFPSMYSEIIPDGFRRTLIPPGSRAVISIFISIPLTVSSKNLSISVDFEDLGAVYLSPEKEEFLNKIREPDPSDLRIV